MKHLILLLAALTPAFGEGKFKSQLNRAQRTFEQQSTSALLPEYKRYVTELAALERSLASNKDFEGAAKVQTERLKIKSIIASSKSPTSAKRRPLTFKKQDAVSDKNTLTWTPKPPIVPGGYKILLEPEVKGALISEGFHTAKPGQPLRITTGNTITITLPQGANFTRLTLTPGA